MGRSIMRISATAAALGFTLSSPPASAASAEAKVKAAYLYKLASFVRWPDGAGPRGQFKMCVAGSNEVAVALRGLVRGERALGAPVTVATLAASQAGDARSCHILYVARGRETAQALAGAVSGAPVLTVADRNGGTRGGVIDFVVRDGKVRFMIDRGLARRQRVELSSKLLDIALAVEP